MSSQMQRQRHGVAKNIVEGVGGIIVGAAAVVLLRTLMKKKSSPKTPAATGQLAQTTKEVEA